MRQNSDICGNFSGRKFYAILRGLRRLDNDTKDSFRYIINLTDYYTFFFAKQLFCIFLKVFP